MKHVIEEVSHEKHRLLVQWCFLYFSWCCDVARHHDVWMSELLEFGMKQTLLVKLICTLRCFVMGTENKIFLYKDEVSRRKKNIIKEELYLNPDFPVSDADRSPHGITPELRKDLYLNKPFNNSGFLMWYYRVLRRTAMALFMAHRGSSVELRLHSSHWYVYDIICP